MKKIVSIIRKTNGVFASTLPQERQFTSKSIPYIKASEDKKNIANDAKTLYLGLKKATGEAMLKLVL